MWFKIFNKYPCWRYFFGKIAGLNLVSTLKNKQFHRNFSKIWNRYQGTQFSGHLPVGCLLLCCFDWLLWKSSCQLFNNMLNHMSFISCITQFITQAEIFQVKCKFSPLLEVARSALNNLHSDKFLCNIEKEQDIF